MKKKVYFAHPINTYDTILEKFALENFSVNHPNWEIVNPNAPEHQEGYKNGGMEYFKQVVLNCDKLVAIGFGDNSIGAGIAKEMNWMREKNGDVYFISLFTELDEMVVPCENQFKVLSVDETRAKLKSY